MATAGSVKAKIIGLIDKSNATTGNTDADLTTAVDALVEGYGKGGSTVETQEKTVNVTENGTTEVLPDEGFALSKVTVNTNVASGGGGEQPTLFAPFLEVKDTEELKRATFTMAANEQNGGFDVSIALRVNGEIVENPYTATEVGTYTVEAIASAENFADGVNTQIVEVAEHPLYSEGLEYGTYYSDVTQGWRVSYGTCTDAHVRVPAFYEGKPVFAVSGFGKSAIETITLPDSVVVLYGTTFEGASNLVSINIPSGVHTWSGSVFRNCNKLPHVDIPKGVNNIPGSAFQYCAALEHLEMPKNITSIGDAAFHSCKALEYIDFSNHESVPNLKSNSAIYRGGGKVEIRVPTALYDEWISATNWASAIANYWITVVPV